MKNKFIATNNLIQLLNFFSTAGGYVGGEFISLLVDIYGDEYEKDENDGKWHRVSENTAIKQFLGEEMYHLPDVV